MVKSTPSDAGPDIGPDAARAARLIARAVLKGALATNRRAARDDAQGQPYVSKVGVAAGADGAPLFLFSTLAAHTQDLLADPRASVLLEAPSRADNPLEGARCTLVGRMEKVPDSDVHAARALYLARHPGAALYADFGDFAMWRLIVDKVHYVGGFGRAKWVKGAGYLLHTPDLTQAEGRILKTVNAAALQALCGQASGRKAQGWRALAVDGDGLVAARFAQEEQSGAPQGAPQGVPKGAPKGAQVRINFATPAADARGWRARFQRAAKLL